MDTYGPFIGGAGWCPLLFLTVCFCLTAISNVKGDKECVEGWTLFYQDSMCVKVMADTKVTWDDARASCQKIHGDLVRITSKKKRVFMTDMHQKAKKSALWIGLHRYTDTDNKKLYNKFHWLDETRASHYIFFAHKRPFKDPSTGSNCVRMGKDDPHWTDDACNGKFGYVCETNAVDVAPLECPPGWTIYQKQCLRLYTPKKTWQDARDFCREQKGHLADIGNENKQFFINTELLRSVTLVWIGLNDITKEESFEWIDSNAGAQYAHSKLSQLKKTNDKNKDCVQINAHSNAKEWLVTSCDYSRAFLCQKDANNADVLCAPGWDLNIEYQTCVKRFQTRKSWTGARQDCKRFEADLAVIMDNNYSKYIRGWLSNSVDDHWIGLHQVGKVPVWLDQGKKAKYTEFSRQPQEPIGCAYMSVRRTFWMETNCNEISKKSYICQKQPYASISCPDGYTPYTDGATCVKLSTDANPWEKARESCQSDGGDLLTIESAKMNSYITSLINVEKAASYWIGLHSRHQNKIYQWLDNTSALPFKRWSPNQLPNDDGTKNCADMTRGTNGFWTEKNCAVSNNYICQHPATMNGKKPDTNINKLTCREGWSMYERENTCIKFHSQRLTWKDARVACKKGGGDLIKIVDENFAKFVTDQLKKQAMNQDSVTEIFIGLSDVGTTKHYRWLDETEDATYTQWISGVQSALNKCGAIVTSTKSSDNYKWDHINCKDTRNFICQEDTRFPSSVNCGTGWEDSTDGEWCYRFNTETLNRHDALRSCYINGGSLLSVPTSSEMFYIMGLIGNKGAAMYWSGGNRRDPSYGWSWNDGQPFAYVNWDNGEPSVNASNDCIAITGKTARWRAVSSQSHLPSICKKAADVDFQTTVLPATPAVPDGKKWGCPSIWSEFKDSCYIGMVAKTGIDWKGANKECHQNGASLVSIKDRSENNFVLTLLPSDFGSTWIGLNDLRSRYTFDWSDGVTSVTYTNWNTDQPVVAGTDSLCGQMKDATGKWKTALCTGLNKYLVCKQEKSIRSKEDKTKEDKSCSQGGLGYLDKCYLYIAAVHSFSESQMVCQRYGGNLATINNAHVQAFLATHVRATTWIGLSNTNKLTGGDNKGHSVYSWTSGDSLRYTLWDIEHTGLEEHMCVGMLAAPVKGLWHNLQCEESHPFFCEYPRPGYTTPTPFKATTSRLPCPDGWTGIGPTMCYYVARPLVGVNWIEAKSACKGMVTGATLASITSQEMSDELMEAINIGSKFGQRSPFWIGLSDQHEEGGFEWDNGEPFVWANWAFGNPDDVNGREDCVLMDANLQMSWDDDHCYTPNEGYICQAPRGAQVMTTLAPLTGVTDIRCGSGWRLYSDSCYKLTDSWSTWFDARTSCHNMGADLVSIADENEAKFVTTMGGGVYPGIWIGLTDLDDDVYRWSDGSPLQYILWAKGQPYDADRGARCVLMMQDGLWKTLHCSIEVRFACEKQLGVTGTPVTVGPPTPAVGGCPLNFHGLPGTSKCYRVMGIDANERMSFDDAIKSCKSISGVSRLASIQSSIDQDFLTTLIADLSVPVWIGLYHGISGKFRWVDNMHMDFVNWAPGKPRRWRGLCAAMSANPMRAGKWETSNCRQKQPFVCQHQKGQLFPTDQPKTEGCPDGYKRFKESCYKYIKDPKTWTTSQFSCTKEGGNLAWFMDGFDTAFVNLLLDHKQNETWIGLNLNSIGQTFSWINGWPVLYTDWLKDPDLANSCVSRAQDGRWETQDCNLGLPSLCQIDLNPVLPPTAAPGYCPGDKWLRYGEHCYHVEAKQLRSWSEAGQMCQAIGADLLSVHDVLEMLFVANSLASDRVDAWIGLEKTWRGGRFRWTDQTELEFLNWASGSPSQNETNTCVIAQGFDGKWTNTGCEMNHGYVCKTKQTPYPSTTTTTTETTTTETTTTTATEKIATTTTTTRTVPTKTESTTVAVEKTVGTMTHTTETVTKKEDKLKSKGGPYLTDAGIAGVVLGVLAIVGIVGAIVFWVRKYPRSLTPNSSMTGFDNALFDRAQEENNSVEFHKSSSA